MNENFERDKNCLRLALKQADVFPTDEIVIVLMGAVDDICRQRIAQGLDTWTHPALAVFVEMLGRPAYTRLPECVRVEIKRRIGTNPRADDLRAVILAWTLRGYASDNVEGILEWYERGIPQRTVPGSGPQASTLKEMGLA
jgi:hypothetical protein